MNPVNPQTKQPYRILWFGDLVTPSGFGRIGNEVTRRLAQRGYAMQGAAMSYTGWPHDLPFHVWPLGERDIFQGLVGIVNNAPPAQRPDLIISCQDFPYHLTLWQACRIDFSRIKWIWITPIDGTPIHPEWLRLVDFADGAMVISRFGVEAMRQAGKRVALCHPGVNTQEFTPAEADERHTLREAAGYADHHFVVGVMCMNQGRKAIAPMIELFSEFAKDKPDARLYLDMDKISPAGWDIPNLLTQMGWSEENKQRVLYRQDVFEKTTDAQTGQSPFHPLRTRYALLNLHMVLSHREGFGLPHLEAMACRVPTMALDWCSGPEIVGDGRGLLVKRLPYLEHGTWGGARDAFPDLADALEQLNHVYDNRTRLAHIAEHGHEWAVQQTWDKTTDQVEAVIQAALMRARKDKPQHVESISVPTPGLSDTGGPAETIGLGQRRSGRDTLSTDGTTMPAMPADDIA